ncbi:MAG: GNAT family N-acetyltransferase [Chloroflexi bacterium]|nr:MAG: GNAT family N-acetyltransferase [Chloroflexota bacterium]
MVIEIREINQSTLQNVNQVDGSFLVDSRLILTAVDGHIQYTIEPVPSYTKTYDIEPLDYQTFIDNPNKTILFAYADDEVAGQIILRVNWNKFAYVEDIAVDLSFRRLGVGGLLMSRAIDWAREKNLPGIMLETQDINVPACRFYERCGFVMAGFDRLLYKATLPGSEEIALYWYLIF